jgi:predicted transcriptional regulator
MLRGHLRFAHGLEIADYRARWQLPVGYPLTAPCLAARRSTLQHRQCEEESAVDEVEEAAEALA